MLQQKRKTILVYMQNFVQLLKFFFSETLHFLRSNLIFWKNQNFYKACNQNQ